MNGSIPDLFDKLPLLQSLQLADNGFTGTIPDSILTLSMLEVLALQENQLSGAIPNSIGNLTSLTDLYVSPSFHLLYQQHLFSSLYSFSLTHLLFSQLYSNQLSEAIPDSIGNLGNLIVLYVSLSFPHSYHQLLFSHLFIDFIVILLFTNLISSELSFNQLSGTIPDSIRNLSNLTVLYV